MHQLINFAYLVSSILFILCLRGLSSPEKAKRGVYLGELGMLIAIVATLFKAEVISYEWIIAGMVLGAGFGTAISGWIPMTKMPERIAFSHAFGGAATALVGIAEFWKTQGHVSRFETGALGLEVFLGSLTFTGSNMAFGKLQGFITGAPVTWGFARRSASRTASTSIGRDQPGRHRHQPDAADEGGLRSLRSPLGRADRRTRRDRGPRRRRRADGPHAHAARAADRRPRQAARRGASR